MQQAATAVNLQPDRRSRRRVFLGQPEETFRIRRGRSPQAEMEALASVRGNDLDRVARSLTEQGARILVTEARPARPGSPRSSRGRLVAQWE